MSGILKWLFIIANSIAFVANGIFALDLFANSSEISIKDKTPTQTGINIGLFCVHLCILGTLEIITVCMLIGE